MNSLSTLFALEQRTHDADCTNLGYFYINSESNSVRFESIIWGGLEQLFALELVVGWRCLERRERRRKYKIPHQPII